MKQYLILLCILTFSLNTAYSQVEKKKVTKPAVKEKIEQTKRPVNTKPPTEKPPVKETADVKKELPAKVKADTIPPKPEIAAEAEPEEFFNTLKLEEGAVSPKATIEDIDWISGSWTGEAFGGYFEEIWSDPFGASMMGMFKLVVGGKVQFYEMMTITEEKGTLILRLKHFYSDMKGWEEKDEIVEFPLVKIYDDLVFFDEYTFEKVSAKEMNVFVIIENKDGKKEEVKFVFER